MDTAGEHDNLRAHELCAGVQAGEIVIFDKAYVDFTHLADLVRRKVFWVTRAKDNLQYRVVRKLQHGRDGHILRDDLIRLTGPGSAQPIRSSCAAWWPWSRWTANCGKWFSSPTT